MKSSLAAIVTVFALEAFATSPYESQLGDILMDFSSSNRTTRLDTTNRLDALMRATTNRAELATCKLLKAKLRTECADITGPEDIYDADAYDDVTNLCWSVLGEFAGEKNAWHFYGATILLAKPLSMDNRHDEIYCSATNALAGLCERPALNVETNVWTALFGAESLQEGNIQTLLRTLAAMSLWTMDRTADIGIYTNALPATILEDLKGFFGTGVNHE